MKILKKALKFVRNEYTWINRIKIKEHSLFTTDLYKINLKIIWI